MSYDITKAFKRIEKEIIESMMRNLDKHRADETDEGIEWSQWQVEQLAALEEFKKRNAKRYGKEFAKLNDMIDSLILEQRAAGQSTQEEAILKAIKNGFKASKKTGLEGNFFKTNDKKLNALINATKNDLKKAERAILRMADDKYRQIIFNAQVYATSGAGTYEKAVDMATKDFLRAGINCVEYKNGARHTLADYSDMALRTANKRAYLTGEGEMRQAWGISTVIINKRNSPCPKCLPFVGKVLIDDVWSGGSGISETTGIRYPLMSDALAAGLYHPRCKDSHTTYFEGISTPPDDKWTKEELDRIAESYKKEQEANYYNIQAEKYHRLAKYSLDEDNKRIYQARAEAWECTTI